MIEHVRVDPHRTEILVAERVQFLGFQQVVVIDDDLGLTGTGTQERPGFGWLSTAVCQKAAGAVVA